ncbi:hypothetical protein [Bromus-associated circular DNA virus 1]|uniref:hypothetical protein n=1 Tax=Bromus-associated circular DNA virus 1 TaxID=1590154 RepID=UPI0005861361|nr:hypothetical protein [Bromus-associated circular DNA virus 1]AJC52518.1 hypothetical protein [Bromus-associated circular DNA virus 1]AJC52523.1 hypothetical protein [Bromus-associated circular DNA virus 1]
MASGLPGEHSGDGGERSVVARHVPDEQVCGQSPEIRSGDQKLRGAGRYLDYIRLCFAAWCCSEHPQSGFCEPVYQPDQRLAYRPSERVQSGGACGLPESDVRFAGYHPLSQYALLQTVQDQEDHQGHPGTGSGASPPCYREAAEHVRHSDVGQCEFCAVYGGPGLPYPGDFWVYPDYGAGQHW